MRPAREPAISELVTGWSLGNSIEYELAEQQIAGAAVELLMDGDEVGAGVEPGQNVVGILVVPRGRGAGAEGRAKADQGRDGGFRRGSEPFPIVGGLHAGHL